ncbi:MAG: asparagine synthase (glutamine-hydrolyzing) [Lachnospiraceae bacterium]|nr:asparagine synthase (glutamine-hydrolyzing) [Lachnospiraceae bacterium]
MCGIAGYTTDKKINPEIIRRMTDRLEHRGPDAAGEWFDPKGCVVLGHRRLAIRDLKESGAQPMSSSCGRYVISYNGEIYNSDELKAAVEETGFRSWRGSSDTEILLEAVAHLGLQQTLRQIKGMFAFALFDCWEESLTLCRDRIGEKPLYYGRVGESFVFASELPAIAEFPDFTAKIRQDVLPVYMLYGYIPAPTTIYEGIYKLRPGGILRLKAPYRDSDIKSGLYYDLRRQAAEALQDPFTGTFEEAADELERLLTDAVKGQLASDVPLGAYLSGGIDSATVVALMSKLQPGSVETFSIGFTEKEYDESAEAKAVAEHLGTKHTQQIVTEEELKAVIPKIAGIYGEPYADSSQIPTYLVSRLAKSKVTVALSGDAGDELFCGYRTYPQIEKLWKTLRLVPKGLRKPLGKLAEAHPLGIPKLYRAGCCLQAGNILELKEAVDHYDPYIAKLTGTSLSLKQKQLWGDEMQQMLLDDLLRYHPEDILVKVDRAGMAVSLENRIPMLDKDVVEFALRLPAEYKYDGGVQKRILKEVLYRYVPKELMERPKKGFAVPLKKWLSEGDTAEWAAELMEHSMLAGDGLLEAEAVSGLWKDFRGQGRSPRLVWNVLMLEQWYREWVKKEGN